MIAADRRGCEHRKCRWETRSGLRDAIVEALVNRADLFSRFGVDPLVDSERALVAVGYVGAQVAAAVAT